MYTNYELTKHIFEITGLLKLLLDSVLL